MIKNFYVLILTPVYYKLCLSVYIIIILGLLGLGSYAVHIYHKLRPLQYIVTSCLDHN